MSGHVGRLYVCRGCCHEERRVTLSCSMKKKTFFSNIASFWVVFSFLTYAGHGFIDLACVPEFGIVVSLPL